MNRAVFDQLLWRTTKQPPEHAQTVIFETEITNIRMRDTQSDKPAVVFLCDPPVTVEAYDELIRQLDHSYRVVIIELPGFGFSRPQQSGAYQFEEAVVAVETALLKLDAGPLIVCGPCICGFVAAELARRKKVPISGLILIQTPDLAGMRQWCSRMDPKGMLRRKYIGQLIVRWNARKIVSFWYKYATAKAYDYRPIVTATLDALSAGAAYPLASMLQLWTRGLNDDQVDTPTMIVWGKEDRSHKHTDPKSTLTFSPQAELVEFDGCGHFPELEMPERFVEAVAGFLKTNAVPLSREQVK
ncbi:MAG: alpha/beta fold hydrolase [Anaerolineae bacterium]